MTPFDTMRASLGQGPALDSRTRRDDAALKTRIRHVYGQLPLSFEANRGQLDPQVDFQSRGSGYAVFLTRGEAVLLLLGRTGHPETSGRSTIPGTPPLYQEERQAGRLRLQLVGANRAPGVDAEEELAGTVNYFIGNDPARWHAGIPTYAKATYRDAYPGIDLVHDGNQQQLEYDFIVRPGSSPGVIQLRFDGADRIEVDAQGDLMLHTVSGEIRQSKPQDLPGGQRAPSRDSGRLHY